MRYQIAILLLIASRVGLADESSAGVGVPSIDRSNQAEVLGNSDGHGNAADFECEIAPLMARRCIGCHDAADPKGGLDLSRRAAAFLGGDSGVAIAAGDPAGSLLWTHVESDEMPLGNSPLSTSEKAILKKWIVDGANWTVEFIDPAIYGHTPNPDRWISRLTVDEYIETVRSTLGVDIRDEALEHLPKDLRADGFQNTAYNLTVDFGHVSGYATLAQRIVQKLDVGKFARQFTKKKTVTDKNMRPLVKAMGERILRSRITEDEIALYRGITTTATLSGGSFEDSVGYVIEAMLQSPKFLYRIEPTDSERENLWEADPFEVASRLSYTLWGGPPDDNLFQAAQNKRLESRQAVAKQIDRMLKDPRCIDRSMQFVTQWLNLDRLEHLQPNQDRFPQWDPGLADDMRRETMDTFRHWVWELDEPLVGLIDAPLTFVSPRLAKHYKMPPQSEDWALRDLSNVKSRGGILTHGSLLTIGGDDASMVTRGLFVLHDLLFSEVGDPPPGLDLTPVPTAPGLTHRIVALNRINNEACGGCHKRFEPLSFGLERYDGLGTYREFDEHGNQLRQDGQILFPGSSEPVAYQSTAELASLLAASDRVAECLTRKVIQFSLGRPLDLNDAATVRLVYHAAGGRDATYAAILKEMLLAFP